MKRTKKKMLVAIVLLILGGCAACGGYWHFRKPSLQHRVLDDGHALTLVIPSDKDGVGVLMLLPDDQLLSEQALLRLSQDTHARIAQLSYKSDTCTAQQHRIKEATDALEGRINLVAGIGAGATAAWRWLATQQDDKAGVLSVGFDLAQTDCSDTLPGKAPHGNWTVIWNDNPSDASARFVRSQPNAQSAISDYDTPLVTLLKRQVIRLLSVASVPVPVIELPTAGGKDTVTFYYSGDGGWRDLDKDSAAQMVKLGYPVVGVDCLRYFWSHKSPEKAASDLEQLMQRYRQQWGARQFVLVGFSYGANVIPALYNRLSPDDQNQIKAIILLSNERSGSFEIEVQGWLGKTGKEASTGPEMARLPADKLLCIYGEEEGQESGCTQPGIPGTILKLPGGHHFDKDYPALARRMVEFIQSRPQ